MRLVIGTLMVLNISLLGCGATFDQRMDDQISAHGLHNEKQVVLVDYDRAITSTRLYVVNPKQILFSSAAGHAWNSGWLFASEFSNTPNSELSSLGVYKVGIEYKGKFGRSLKLHGLSKTNSNAYKRAIVLHRQPSWRLWSLGCITVPDDDADPLIDMLKPGTKMVVYD